ncbi:hypothetical protein CK203_113651 [Vitis vinifera]|uniref:Uncharacterized protein n=1 Tax=Vitis vinifera TaxID=29760 RepID=A0A438EG97_VITVI|nr:hypothetical protein CK203_113651 [Vitis vinifera]
MEHKYVALDKHKRSGIVHLKFAPLVLPSWKRWIYHHYCAMIMALVSLTWEIKGQPNCAQKQRGVQLFLQWAMMQGVAMLLQNRYQRQRLYTRIALGKGDGGAGACMVDNAYARSRIPNLGQTCLQFTFYFYFQAKRMDVVWGETAGVDGQLWLLCPILFILQHMWVYCCLRLHSSGLFLNGRLEPARRPEWPPRIRTRDLNPGSCPPGTICARVKVPSSNPREATLGTAQALA